MLRKSAIKHKSKHFDFTYKITLIAKAKTKECVVYYVKIEREGLCRLHKPIQFETADPCRLLNRTRDQRADAGSPRRPLVADNASLYRRCFEDGTMKYISL